MTTSARGAVEVTSVRAVASSSMMSARGVVVTTSVRKAVVAMSVRVVTSLLAMLKTGAVAACLAAEDGGGSPDNSRGVVIGDVKDRSKSGFGLNSNDDGDKEQKCSRYFRPRMGLRDEGKKRRKMRKRRKK